MAKTRRGYQVRVRRRQRGDIVRWVLRNSRNCYWAGTDWTNDARKASLYADAMEARPQAAFLELVAPQKRYFTFLNVEVDAANEFTPEELAAYLARNLLFHLNDDSGSSSLDEARIHFNIDADMIQEW